MRTRLLAAAAVLTLCTAPFVAGDSGKDWSRYRGPLLAGSSLGNSLLDREAVGLEIAWKRPLGSGYSSISVVGDTGVTMFTDGEDDVVAAFDAASGAERWRYRIAEKYAGHSGSDDGPISTPAIHDGTVYGLGPRGQLFALRLEDGGEVWSRALGEADSRAPHYGFATAPLVVDDLLVVQTGGAEGHSITAFDRTSGAPRWSMEDDPVNYQSPAVLELGGSPQVVAVNDKYLLGIAPASGEVLWKHEHGTLANEAFALPLALGEDRVLVNSLAEVAAFSVQPGDGGWTVEEAWRADGFKNSYAIPVYHEGHLFGFSGRFLTCLDAATGERVWRSRPPGGQGLILVDAQLVILAAAGDLVIAEASPEGYREKARLALFERGYYTPPSFASGHVFARNLTEMAAVRVTGRAMPRVAEKAERELRGELGALVERAEAADDPAALVDEYFAGQESFPIIEGDGLVHFVYRGEVEDIALAGNFLPWGEEEVMDRIAGTDVYFKSLELDPKAIWEYRFSVDFGEPTLDPENPHSVQSLLGPMSQLRMPRWVAPDYFAEVDAPAGRVDSFQFRSDVMDGERRVRLYLPDGYAAAPEARYPLAVVLHGNNALDDGDWDRALDNLIAAGRMAPAIVAFLERAGGREYSGPPLADFARMLAEELVPHLDKHYRTVADPSARAILGPADGGVAALYAATQAPGTFGRVAVQSAIAVPPMSDELPDLIRGAEKRSLTVHVEARRHDFKIDPAIDAAGLTRSLIDVLAEADHDVVVRELAGSWGWGSWSAHLDDILGSFYPPPAKGE